MTPTTTLRIVAGPCVYDGDAIRWLELPNGAARIEWWRKGVGWVEAPDGAFRLDNFWPTAHRPILPKDRVRLGMPPLYDTSTGAKIVGLIKARAWDLACRRLPPGHA